MQLALSNIFPFLLSLFPVPTFSTGKRETQDRVRESSIYSSLSFYNYKSLLAIILLRKIKKFVFLEKVKNVMEYGGASESKYILF